MISRLVLQRPRDPRFSDLSGVLSTDKFRSHYEFLPSLHTSELSTLKESLSRARKLLVSSPRHLRPDREEEVQRLELAVKKAESTVNRERREEAERQALARVHQEEKEKRKVGKGAWWMKDGTIYITILSVQTV
jgi:ribosomal RNA-processing protein 36